MNESEYEDTLELNDEIDRQIGRVTFNMHGLITDGEFEQAWSLFEQIKLLRAEWWRNEVKIDRYAKARIGKRLRPGPLNMGWERGLEPPTLRATT